MLCKKNYPKYNHIKGLFRNQVITLLKESKGSRGEAPGGLGKAQPKVKFSPAFFKRRWGPGAKPWVGLGKAQLLFLPIYIFSPLISLDNFYMK